jgi:hypothetical protein
MLPSDANFPFSHFERIEFIFVCKEGKKCYSLGKIKFSFSIHSHT